jgi:hypothetical protein
MFSSHLSEYGLYPYMYSRMEDFRSFHITEGLFPPTSVTNDRIDQGTE